ncbi:MAG: TlpA family protein disulfide reductase [Bacteroidaceae bacterium]|nr:TlpA family protein disulfide reductase [Bacteroidaceae bacterium]
MRGLILSLMFVIGVGSAAAQDYVPYKNFALRDTSGTVHQLREYVQKNRYVLVEFWASWCYPCRREVEHLRHLRKVYGERGFEIVGVSLDKTDAELKASMAALCIDWPQLTDFRGWHNTAAREYGVEYIPYCVLIDGEGGVVYAGSPDDCIERILADKLSD